MLRTKYPDIGIFILGDFNRMNMHSTTRGNDLFQLVDFPTRGNATLDLVLTNHSSKSLYNKPTPFSPIGLSDPCSVLWKPKIYTKPKNKSKVYVSRPSGIGAFGQWIQDQD